MLFKSGLCLGIVFMLHVADVSANPYLVASDYQGPMRRVDLQTGAVTATFAGGYGAGEIDLGPDGLIYASYFEGRSIGKINPVTGASVGNISLGGKPRDVTFGPEG